jgi:hypothetical protein
VAISICDFELWPDAAQEARGLDVVPMLSRWNMTERVSGNSGLFECPLILAPARGPEPPQALARRAKANAKVPATTRCGVGE